MSIDEKTIRETLLKGERVTLECKKAQSNVPVDAWKTYSAFANTYGGLILLGVYEDLKEKDISKRFTITGVDDAAKIRKDFWNIVPWLAKQYAQFRLQVCATCRHSAFTTPAVRCFSVPAIGSNTSGENSFPCSFSAVIWS